MPIENEDQAIAALADASAQDAGNAQVSQPSEPVQTTDDSAQATDQPRIDPATLNLSPEAQAYLEQREREMQGDYTRKTQEVAAQRREAEQAMEFIHALNNDPSFAAQVHQTLAQALEAQGYQNQPQAPQDPFADDGFEDPYMQKIQQLENWQAQQEQRYAVQEATSRIEGGINAIRQANPSYTDDDVKDILTMAFAYDGDVFAAEEAYKAVTQRVTEGYLAQKESVPASLNQPSAASHAEIPPEGFTSLNDPRLEQAARNMLENAGAQW